MKEEVDRRGLPEHLHGRVARERGRGQGLEVLGAAMVEEPLGHVLHHHARIVGRVDVADVEVAAGFQQAVEAQQQLLEHAIAEVVEEAGGDDDVLGSQHGVEATLPDELAHGLADEVDVHAAPCLADAREQDLFAVLHRERLYVHQRDSVTL